jgi:hypothetical protein
VVSVISSGPKGTCARSFRDGFAPITTMNEDSALLHQVELNQLSASQDRAAQLIDC